MALSPPQIIPDRELLPELRDLFDEYPFIARQSPEAVCRALLVLRGIEATEFAVGGIMESLRNEDGVLCP